MQAPMLNNLTNVSNNQTNVSNNGLNEFYSLHKIWIAECKNEYNNLSSKLTAENDLNNLETCWLSKNPPLIKRQPAYCHS